MFRDICDTAQYTLGDTIVLKSPGKGLGVFSNRSFEKNEVIEVSPVVLFPHKNFLINFIINKEEDMEFREYSATSIAMATSKGYPPRHIIADYPFSWIDGK